MCEVATTNYDTLLESAIDDQFSADPPNQVSAEADPGSWACRQVTASTSDPRANPSAPKVTHLHGYLDYDGQAWRAHDVVISEDDYLKADDSAKWRIDVLNEARKATQLVFIGASMTDLNLLRALYTSPSPDKSPRPLVLVNRSPVTGTVADEWTGHLDEAQQHELLARRKWQSMGVEVLYPDWYMQNAQFVLEVIERRSKGDSYESYSKRLADWHQEFAEKSLGLHQTSNHFQTAQDKGSAMLYSWVRQVEELLNLSPEDCRDESLTLHLWTRIPADRSLALSLRSDASWKSARRVDRRRITLPSRPTAIRAFCYGYPQVQRHSRGLLWESSIAIPIRIDSPKFGPLPVGVVVLMSKRNMEDSAVFGPDSIPFQHVIELLLRNAQSFLDPSNGAQ